MDRGGVWQEGESVVRVAGECVGLASGMHALKGHPAWLCYPWQGEQKLGQVSGELEDNQEGASSELGDWTLHFPEHPVLSRLP